MKPDKKTKAKKNKEVAKKYHALKGNAKWLYDMTGGRMK